MINLKTLSYYNLSTKDIELYYQYFSNFDSKKINNSRLKMMNNLLKKRYPKFNNNILNKNEIGNLYAILFILYFYNYLYK